MRIRFAATSGPEFGQFIVNADDDQDAAILTAFLRQLKGGDPRAQFTLHGMTLQDSLYRSFNFGILAEPRQVQRPRAIRKPKRKTQRHAR